MTRRAAAATLALAALAAAPAAADTLDVCPTGCTYSTITDALAAAISGDLVDVSAGTWTGCYLTVPSEVTLAGAGPTTIADGTTCGAGALVFVEDGGALAGLRLHPDPAVGTGVEFLGSGIAVGVEIRGGYTLMQGPSTSTATVYVESSLLVGGPNTVTGVDSSAASWTLQQVTLVRVGGASGTGISGAGGVVEVQESILTGWGTAALGTPPACYIALSGLFGNGQDLDGCDEPATFANWDEDPLYADPSGVHGDFHLQSSVGEWDGAAFLPGLTDSPYLSAGSPDPVRADAEGAGPCNLPNLGGYGGSAEASRWPTLCLVQNIDTGAEYRSLAQAAAAGGAPGEVLQLADGLHLQAESILFNWSAHVVAALGAEAEIRSTWTSSEPLVRTWNGSSTPPLIFEGVTVGPNLDGGGVAFSPGELSRAFRLTLEDCVVLGDAAIVGWPWSDQRVIVTNSSLGTAEAPLAGSGIVIDTYDSGASVTLQDTTMWAGGTCIAISYGVGNSNLLNRSVTISGSTLRCGSYGLSDSTVTSEPSSTCDLDIQGSAILAGATGVRVDLALHPTSLIRNSLVATTAGDAPLSTGSPMPSLVNVTLVGGDSSVDIGDQAASSLEVLNSVFVDASDVAVVSGDVATGMLPQYNVFWDNAVDASYPIGPTNLTTCDPGLPPVPSDPLDPSFGPSAWVPGPSSCLNDSGHPAASYNDADGTRNDIGATGGPGGDDFLALFDLDGDGYAGTSDCDDDDPAVYAGAPDACGDGLDTDCSGSDAPDADVDGFEDEVCGGADCDDADASISPSATDWSCDSVDQDCDGSDQTDFDGDGYACDVDDCDDASAETSPAASEVCDGLDNDCDGSLLPTEGDDDGDGFLACAAVEPDCDDASAESSPAAPEVCDGADNDCDGAVPADEIDEDGDGSLACADCDDDDPANFPGNPETCDGADNDCDGAAETGGEDDDGDGSALCDSPPDCDDSDPANFPNNPFGEVCDGADNDCDGAPASDETDDDGDGQMPCDGDCDDGDAANADGFLEVCDGADNDCDGSPQVTEVDGDGDGVMVCEGDCDDDAVDTLPEHAELCDGLDNDCDGAPDEDEVDEDGDGVMLCADDCDDDDPDNFPGHDELCDGLDNDCDGEPDPDEIDEDGDGSMICAGDCDDGRVTVAPTLPVELCDGHDSDCDGDLPEAETDPDVDGWIACAGFVPDEPADGLLGGGDCDQALAAVHPTAQELCDGLDNDCDGAPRDDELDADADGYAPCTDYDDVAWSTLTGGHDCDDGRDAVHPDATELCDAIDQDCDNDLVEGFADLDADGLPDCTAPDDLAVPAPGCQAACDAASPPSAPGLLIWLPLLFLLRGRSRPA